MLDPEALSQLKNLKQDIVASKDVCEGIVASTSGKFGFVRLEDKRDAFLSPDKMQRLLPGDRVRAEIISNERGKIEATVEKILESTLDRFVGVYKVKGAGHFIEPTDPAHNRWIFVPPAHRQSCRDGDYAVAKITRHPKTDGKAQAQILDRIGAPSESHFEKRYVVAKYELNYRLSSSEEAAIREIEAVGDIKDERYKDLTHLPFVTIDSEMTRDMDDALYVELLDTKETETDDYDNSKSVLRLHIAIADPASFIARDSVIDKLARGHGQTSYLLGGSIPMLPKSLSIGTFSLVENEARRTIVTTVDIDPTGEVVNVAIEPAIIKSHAKLSYDQVSSFITAHCPELPAEKRLEHDPAGPDQEPISEKLIPHVLRLFQIYKRRNPYRKQNHIVSDIGDELDLKLDDRGHITSVEKRSRHIAHLIVEEAMIVANIEIAKKLSLHGAGLHLTSPGIRKERLGEARALLRDAGIDSTLLDTKEGLIKLFSLIRTSEDEDIRYLEHPLKRMFAFSELSLEPGVAANQGLDHYCHFTSPIRRYDDLYNHQALRTLLFSKDATPNDKAVDPKPMSENELTKLKEKMEASRRADHELTRWLSVIYAKQFEGQEDSGIVRVVTQKGFGVRLDSIGVDGFVQFTKQQTQAFDTKRMTISDSHTTYKLNDKVNVKIKSVDVEKRRVNLTVT